MTRHSPFTLAALLLIGLIASAADAAVITFDITNVGGNRWRYDYAVDNNRADAIEEFTIVFSLGSYSNLAVVGTPIGWDSLVVQPDPGIPADGFFDSLAIGAGLAPGDSLNGFAVLFDWSGTSDPGRQSFELIDPVTFATLARGRTVASADVPEPLTLGLVGLGTAVLLERRRRARLDLRR